MRDSLQKDFQNRQKHHLFWSFYWFGFALFIFFTTNSVPALVFCMAFYLYEAFRYWRLVKLHNQVCDIWEGKNDE